jgi:hypothetical protein
MDYAEAKKRVTLQYYFGRTSVFGHDRLSKPERMEYKALLSEFGEPEEDTYYEDTDALLDHLAGCLDPAPQWICDEVSGVKNGGTWHRVYVEHVTNWLMDSGDEGDAASALRLYEVYCKDLMIHPDQTPSRQGFQAWCASMVPDGYVEDLMHRLPEDLAAVPS